MGTLKLARKSTKQWASGFSGSHLRAEGGKPPTRPESEMRLAPGGSSESRGGHHSLAQLSSCWGRSGGLGDGAAGDGEQTWGWSGWGWRAEVLVLPSQPPSPGCQITHFSIHNKTRESLSKLKQSWEDSLCYRLREENHTHYRKVMKTPNPWAQS